MTTLIILTLLVAAWTGYFIYCVKDSSVVMQMRNSTEAFSRKPRGNQRVCHRRCPAVGRSISDGQWSGPLGPAAFVPCSQSPPP